MTSTEMTTSIIYEEGDIVGSDWEITEDNPDLNQPSNQPQTSEYIANRIMEVRYILMAIGSILVVSISFVAISKIRKINTKLVTESNLFLRR
ncbi:MAG: hypothetical protein ACXADA_18285 [Candidatus Hodarchaeales archaeon]|jgi:hypothetical protein